MNVNVLWDNEKKTRRIVHWLKSAKHTYRLVHNWLHRYQMDCVHHTVTGVHQWEFSHSAVTAFLSTNNRYMYINFYHYNCS